MTARLPPIIEESILPGTATISRPRTKCRSIKAPGFEEHYQYVHTSCYVKTPGNEYVIPSTSSHLLMHLSFQTYTHKNRAGSFSLRSPINEMQINTGQTQIIMVLQDDHSCILLCISWCGDDPAIISQLVLALFIRRWTTVRHACF